MPAFLGKSRWMVFCSIVITSLLSLIIKMTWLNCCKVFWWFYCFDTEDTIFFWFRCLVCKNYFQLLFVLIILEVTLIVCFKLMFLILFLLVVLWIVYQQIILHYLLVASWVVCHEFFLSSSSVSSSSVSSSSEKNPLRLSFQVYF